MASSLAAQLSQIAATSTNQLDLKAQKAAHSQSLIFEKKIAKSQDFNTIYRLCYEGFEELCLLDPRFAQFGRTIFSEQSKAEDRTEMTADQNKQLDNVVEAFLALVGARLLLSPAVKAVDWLIRRFRVHEYNTSFLILTFLPYHTTPLFLNLLSILPEDITSTFKILYPYKRSLINPPRHPIVHSAATNKLFCAALNNYILQVSRAQTHYHALFSFWVGIMAEAVSGMLDSAKSGKRDVESRNQEDVLHRILPVLNDGFTINNVPELTIGCYMISVVLANKSSLQDQVLDSLMETVATTWTEETRTAGITCISVLSQQKEDLSLPKKVIRSIIRLDDALGVIQVLSTRYPMSKLLLSLVSGCARNNFKHKKLDCLEFASEVIERKMLSDEQTVVAFQNLLQGVVQLRKESVPNVEFQRQLSDMFERFNESSLLQPMLQKALQSSDIDVASLEFSLQSVVETETPPAIEDVSMEDAEPGNSNDEFTKALEAVPPTTKEISYLSGETSNTFDVLSKAFVIAVGSQENRDYFRNLPVLRRDVAMQEPLYLSFFLRVISGTFPINARVAALDETTIYLSEKTDTFTDVQVILPFLIITLGDASEKVRRKAVALLTVVDSLLSKGKSHEDGDKHKPLGYNSIYGKGEQTKSLHWLSPRDAYKVIHRVLLPGLEEYVLDANQAGVTLENTLRGPSTSDSTDTTSTVVELKKSLRLALFTLLSSHAINCPFYLPKLRLLTLLNRVDKVSSVSRTKQLLPILREWQGLSDLRADQICNSAQMSLPAVEEQVLRIVTPKDKDSVDLLLSTVISTSEIPRPSFVNAVFNRLREIWASFKGERQVSAADKLFQIALGVSAGNEALAGHCRDVLRAVDLSGDVLVKFTQKVPESIADAEEGGPPPKRRRTSQNNTVASSTMSPEDMNLIVEKLTFILELVDNSKPENHPQLTEGLFQSLAALHHFKSQVQSEMSYLVSLVLSSLLSIVNNSKEFLQSKPDSKIIRTDLIVDCVRTSESPQVQNTALLLVAGLATVAPELVLHSVMPIFTFMGSSVLRKDDEYSAHVIDQTIDQVIPPLIRSLRNQKRDVVSGTSELLLSFTTAFEHIPSHRRLRLFEALITKLGSQDFLFAVLTMLANKYASDNDALALMTSLATNFEPELQLITYNKYLDLVKDALKPKPTLSRVLLGIGSEDGRNPQEVSADLLRSLSHLLKDASLNSKLSRSFQSADKEQLTLIRAQFSRLLEQNLLLADTTVDIKLVSQACGDLLGSLLNILSLIDFLDTIAVLLERPNDELRRKVLRLLESRLRRDTERDGVSQARILEFLSTLTKIIQESPDILLKHAAVACIDRISDRYGKKDRLRVVEAAKVISGEKCIGQTDDRIRVMGMLCLASMAEVLGQTIIPVLPQALPEAFRLLDMSLEQGKENSRLHDAVFSLISALLEHVPFMILDNNLDSILKLSFKSANSNISVESIENRREALSLLPKRVEVRESFAAVQRNWPSAVSEGSESAKEALEVISIAIERHPKSSTVKNVDVLFSLLNEAFDLRRTQKTSGNYEDEEIEEVENSVNEITIKMIYKLNDTTFRPLFAKLTEWATKGLPEKDTFGRTMRLTTFYKFLNNFFATLKSIVTGYASYVLENSVDVLQKFRPVSKDSRPLWLAAIRTLRNAFEHDQDEFWQSPNNLNTMSTPLISQLSHATNTSSLNLVVNEAVPAIVELAVAADSPDNHKEMNATIMKYMRPNTNANSSVGGDSPYARLAAVKCEQSLTERLGEEWLALLPEMLPYISELMEDEDERVEKEVRKWVLAIEEILGEKLDDMLI